MTTTTHPEALRQTPGWWHRLAWLPVPLFLASIAILFFLEPGRSYERPHLLLALNFVCSGLPAAFVAYLCARSYLARGVPGLLLLGCGVLLWGAAGMVGIAAGLMETPGPDAANVAITIHNSCVWLSAVCQLAGAVLLLYPRRVIRTPGLWLSAACAIILGLVGLLTLAAVGQWTPTFFVQGRGGTPLRQFVLGSGTAIFVLSSILLWLTGRRIASSFAYWFSLALALIALGLLAVMGQSVQGGILGWTGRAAQFLGSAYMLVAALVSARESHVWGIPLAEALSAAQEQYRALVEMSPDGIVVHADGKWVFANSAALRLFGATREEEILGREALDLVDIDDREAAAGHILLLDRRGQATSSRAFKARRLDGRLLDVESSASRIEYQGRPAVLVVLHDITERKQAEEALRESEVRLRRFYESPLLGVIYWNMAGHITDANDKFLEMVGYTREDLTTGRIDWAAMTPREFRHLDEASAKELKATGVNQQPFEKEYLRKDGSRLPILVAGAMLDEARFNGVAFVLDLAVRKQAEAALRESEAKYRNLFENMTEEVHFWQLVRDEEGRIKTWRLVDANPPTLKTWGKTLDEIKGKTTDEIFGPGATEHYMSVVRKIMTDGVPYVFQDYFPNLDKHFRFTSVPLGDYFFTTGADVTQQQKAADELRKSSAELEAANVALRDSRRAALNVMEDALAARERAEHATAELRQEVAERQRVEEEVRIVARFPSENPSPVLRLDAKGRILFANVASAPILDQWDTAIGSQAPAPWPDTVRDALISQCQTTVEIGCGDRTYVVFVAPIPEAGYVNLYTSDITERKRAEERIKASLREKEVLLKEIHHRVKNNLQVISSLVSLQVDELADPTLRAMFRDVRDRVRSMALVHEKLYESADLAQVQFADYAQSLLAYLWRAHGAAAANIHLKLEMEPVPLSVERAVPCGLILNELAGNALKHAFPGGAAGEVSVVLYTGPDGRVRLGVCDNGVGLPRGMDWRQSRSLGLRLVQMLAAQLNGSVNVQSEAGTEIEVTFHASADREEKFAQTQTYGEERP